MKSSVWVLQNMENINGKYLCKDGLRLLLQNNRGKSTYRTPEYYQLQENPANLDKESYNKLYLNKELSALNIEF